MLADSPRSANQSGFATEHTRTLEIVGASGDAMIDCPIALAMVVTRLANAAPWLSIATPFNEIWNLIFTFFWQTLRPIYPAVVVIVVLTVIRARLVKPWSESVVKHFVFISHRHSVDPWGDLIKTQLATIFGKKAIFLDNDEVKSGDKFDKVIDPALKKCGAFLAVIGTGWLNEIRQLDESHSKDWVRLEIATILGSVDI